MVEAKNLFEYAKKELSQDAIIAWLLNGGHGKEFLFDICPSLKTDLGNDKDIKIEVSTQEESIDILVNVTASSEEKFAVIIEDKTDTYLHNFQMLKYIKKVEEKGGKRKPTYKKVYFVLFKTGDIYAWELDDYNYWRDQINTGKRDFKKEDLNKRVGSILASDSYTKSDITFTDRKDKTVEIKVEEEIYNLNKFKTFLKGKNSSAILEYYKEYLSDKEQDKDKDRDAYTRVSKYAKENELHLEMIKPGGGGKREYEYNILSEKMIIDKGNDEKFLILPFIVKKEEDSVTKADTIYQFIIHCQFVTDKQVIHGYVPWNQLDSNQKKSFSCVKTRIFEEFERKLGEPDWKINNNFDKNTGEAEDEKNNGLQLCKFQGSLNKENLKKLIDTALDIADFVRNEI